MTPIELYISRGGGRNSYIERGSKREKAQAKSEKERESNSVSPRNAQNWTRASGAATVSRIRYRFFSLLSSSSFVFPFPLLFLPRFFFPRRAGAHSRETMRPRVYIYNLAVSLSFSRSTIIYCSSCFCFSLSLSLSLSLHK